MFFCNEQNEIQKASAEIMGQIVWSYSRGLFCCAVLFKPWLLGGLPRSTAIRGRLKPGSNPWWLRSRRGLAPIFTGLLSENGVNPGLIVAGVNYGGHSSSWHICIIQLNFRNTFISLLLLVCVSKQKKRVYQKILLSCVSEVAAVVSFSHPAHVFTRRMGTLLGFISPIGDW